MKTNYLNFTKTAVMSLCAILLLITISCDIDSDTGCTDPDAENYDIDAVTDSGDCTYAADDLIGTYSGSSECTGTLTNPGFNTSSLMFTVSRSAAGGGNDVEVTLPFEGEAFVFKGTVAGNVLTIDDEIVGVNYPSPVDPTMTIVVNVEGTGTMTYFDDDSSLDCPELIMKIKSTASGATIEDGSCAVIGIKQ